MLDPFGVWRTAVQNEANPYVKLPAEVMKAQFEMYSKVLDASIGTFQPLAGVVKTTSAPVIKQLNLVTRAELEAVEERLARIEEQLQYGGTFESIKQAIFKDDSSS